MARKNEKLIVSCVHFTKEQKQWLQKMHKETRLSQGDLVRQSIDMMMDKVKVDGRLTFNVQKESTRSAKV